MATGREVAASLEARVIDEFRRTGIVPAELVRHIQLASVRRSGEIVTTEQVEAYTRDWLNTKLTQQEQIEAN